MTESVNYKIKLSPEIQYSFRKKNWDSFNYIFWGISSIILAMIILEYFMFPILWKTTILFKMLLVGIGALGYSFLRSNLTSPDWLILGTLILFSSYCFTVIQLAIGFEITLFFAILSLVIGFSNYLVLWKSKFSFYEVASIGLIFILIQYNDNFNSYQEIMQLGGYSFFIILLLSAFIPDARKRNYMLNLERELLKDQLLARQNKKLNKVQLELNELEEILKINSEKEKIIRHDLKNKFTNIIGLSQLIEIKDGKITEEDESYLNLLKEVSTDLLKYSDNVFSQSSMEDGSGLKLDLKPLELFHCFKKVKQEITPKLESQGLNLLVSEESKGLYITADLLVFNTVLENILNYLMSWSTSGQQVLIATVELPSAIRIELTAPSAKIPSESLNHIFKPLANFEFQSSFDRPTGLGLQIAKSMTGRMGGYFKYQTDQIEGVVFKIEFPKTISAKS
jgi:signal transduction histidine kinase